MIRLSDVVKEYESGTTALKGISLRIEDGEFVFLVGPSGSGKSTIIKLLTGEIVPTSGQIAVNGFSLTNIAERQIPLLRRSVGACAAARSPTCAVRWASSSRTSA